VRLHRLEPPGRARAIRAEKLLTIDGVYERLAWRTPNGCASCRPAVNYYLISTWPEGGEGRSAVALHQRAQPRQHPEGRHLLGRSRACGAARRPADELRRIADAVDKYKIPTGQGHGGQRIDLLGVKKEDLVASGATSACRRAMPTPRRCAP
jgi:nitrite reductase (NADH) large subunit